MYRASNSVTLNQGAEQCQAGSLTGAVASQSVTEARKGSLSTVGNRAQSVKAARELDCEIDESSRCESRP
jgi:hypothetical protein